MAFIPSTLGFNPFYGDGSVKEHFEGNSGTASVRYWGPWNKRFLFRQNILGWRTITGNQQGSFTITTNPPYAYPEDQRLYAKSVDFTPFGMPTGDPTTMLDQIKVEWCWADISFGTPEYQVGEGAGADGGIEGDTYLTEEYDTEVEFLTVPQSLFEYASDSKLLDSELGLPFPTGSYTINRHQMPFAPVYQDRLLKGKVNVADFRGFAAGTLLYLGMSVRYGDVDVMGQQTYELTYKFSEKLTGWNQVLRPDTRSFDFIRSRADHSTPALLLGDFSILA